MMNTASRLLIALFALIPLLVSGGGALRAKRVLECNCNPFNFQYDVDCCGPACDEPTSNFYVEALCSCDPCDTAGSCYNAEHCCDACSPASRCYNEEECCNACDPNSYCFDFNATDCGVGPPEEVLSDEVPAAATVGSVVTPVKTESAIAAPLTTEDDTTTPVKTENVMTAATSTSTITVVQAAKDTAIYSSSSDDYEIVPERPLYIATIEAGSPKRLGARAETIGSIYPFGNSAYNVSDTSDTTISVEFTGGELHTNITEVSIVHEGYCTRTGTSAPFGYCHWQYTVDGIGTFVATGSLGDPSKESTLAIEGGTGILMGATGYVKVTGTTINSSGFPSAANSSTDALSGVDGYFHNIEIILDEDFRTQKIVNVTST